MPYPDDVRQLANDVAARLSQVAGVSAVSLGGSWARGTARPESDLDIGIYYHPDRPLDLAALRRLAQELDSSGTEQSVTEPGAWGAWINGGAWLQVAGRRVDWLYRDIDKVRNVVNDCIEGRVTLSHQPGHPHGFHNHIYMGELFYCVPLSDQAGELAALKALTHPYPQRLQTVLTTTYLWQAEFALDAARKGISRTDVAYVAGCLFETIECLVQVLFAINRQYFMNEKGAVALVDSFKLRPEDFSRRAAAIFTNLGPSEGALEETIAVVSNLIGDVQGLCNSDVGANTRLDARTQ